MADQSVWDEGQSAIDALMQGESVDPELEELEELRRLKREQQIAAAMAQPVQAAQPGIMVDPQGKPVESTSELGGAMMQTGFTGAPEEQMEPGVEPVQPVGPQGVDPQSVVLRQQAGPQQPQQPAGVLGMPRMPGVPGIAGTLEAAQGIQDVAKEYAGKVGESSEALRGALQRKAEADIGVQTAQDTWVLQQAKMVESGFDAALKLKADLEKRKEKARQETVAAMNSYKDAIREQMKEAPIEGWGLGKRIGTGIAMALGAIGSAYAGGPNQAIQIVKMGMQREAEEHRRRMAQKKRLLGAKSTLYQIATEHFTDVEAQNAAAMASQWEAMKMGIAKEAAKSKSPIIHANARQAVEAINLEQKKLENQLQRSESW